MKLKELTAEVLIVSMLVGSVGCNKINAGATTTKDKLQSYIAMKQNSTVCSNLNDGKNEFGEAVLQYAEVMDEVVQYENDDIMVYKDQFAGSYVNENNELVVQLTGKNEVKQLQDSVENIEYVDMSMNRLTELQEVISNKMIECIQKKNYNETQKKMLDNIVGLGISQEENCIFVQMDKVSKENILWFKKNISDNAKIKFEQSEKMEEKASSINVKCGQYINIGGGGYSFGYRAKDALGNKGFVSAGHGVKKGEEVYDSATESIYLGKVTKVNIQNIDACFVQKTTNSNVTLSNGMKYYINSKDKLQKGKLITAIPEGYSIYKTGFSSGCTYGNVRSTNYTATYDGKVIKDTILTTAYALKYDSGGTVFAYIDGVPVLLGIVGSGTKDESKFGRYMVCIKATNIYNIFGVWPY